MFGVFRKKEKIWEQMGSFARIPSIDFTGTLATSPNGRYHVAARIPFNLNGKLQKIGRCVLFTDYKVLVSRKMENPHFPAVSDNGTFCIQDWASKFQKDRPRGTFYVFSKRGRKIVKRQFRANLLSSAISSDGKYAAVATAASPKEKRSHTLEIFKLPQGKITCQEQVGLVTDMAFDSQTGNLRVSVSSVGDLMFDPRTGKQL